MKNFLQRSGIRLCLPVLLLLLPGLVLASEGNRCLSSLMEAALENRDILKMYEISRRQAEEGVKEKKAAFFPGVDASYTAHRLNDSTLFENDENAAWKLAAKWNLFSGFQDQSLLGMARSRVAVQEALLEGLRQDIRLETALAFLTVHRALAEREVAENARSLYRQEYEHARSRHGVGVIRKADYLKIKVVLDDAEQGWVRADAAVAKAMKQLSRTTGLDLELSDLDFSDFDRLPSLEKEDVLSERMRAGRSELKILALSKTMAEEGLRQAKSAYLPRADLALSHGQSADNYALSDNTKDETRLTLSLSINLFDGLKKPAVVEQNRLAVSRMDHEQRELLDTLDMQLDTLFLDARVAEDNLKVAEAGLAEAEEHQRVTEYSYREGVSTATDLLDAIAYLSQARANRIVARTGYLETALRIRHLAADLDRPF